MGKREQAIRLWRDKRRQKQETIRRNRGMLGDGSGNLRVPNRPELIFMRVNGDPSRIWKVINDTVADVNDLPVIIEKDPDSPLWRVINVERGVLGLSGIGFDDLKRKSMHHEEHEWPAGAPGGDVLTVFPRAIHDLRTEPISTYVEGVVVRPLIYTYEGETKTFPGKLQPLTSYTPVAGVLRVLTYLDVRTNELQVSPGPTSTYTAVSNAVRPKVPWYGRPSAFVNVYQGQTSWVEADIEDARNVIGEEGIYHALQQEREPAQNDDAAMGYSAGSMWVNRILNKVYVCSDPTIGLAVWKQVSNDNEVTFTSTDYTGEEHDGVIMADASGGQITVNLPSATTYNVGHKITVKKIDSSGNLVVLDPAGTEKVDGSLATYPIGNLNQAVQIVSYNAGWWVTSSS